MCRYVVSYLTKETFEMFLVFQKKATVNCSLLLDGFQATTARFRKAENSTECYVFLYRPIKVGTGFVLFVVTAECFWFSRNLEICPLPACVRSPCRTIRLSGRLTFGSLAALRRRQKTLSNVCVTKPIKNGCQKQYFFSYSLNHAVKWLLNSLANF